MNSVAVNDDVSLEHKSDIMGAKASDSSGSQMASFQLKRSGMSSGNLHTIQCRTAVLGRRIEPYRADIERFVQLSSGQKKNYLNKLILGTTMNYKKNHYRDDDIEITKLGLGKEKQAGANNIIVIWELV